jgi:hypothetical protein
MSGRTIVIASFATLLSAAPILAAQSQQPAYVPPSGQGTQTGKMGEQMPKSETGSQVQQEKKIIQPQGETQGTATAPQGEQNEVTGQTGEKTKKVQQPAQQMGQGTGQQGTEKTKKIEGQEGQPSGEVTTGTTGKVANEIPTEKRTLVREKLLAANVEKIDRTAIKVDLTLGAAVPKTIKLYPVPEEVVRIIPAYRGYLFFELADGTIVFVEPGTLRIAYVLTA